MHLARLWQPQLDHLIVKDLEASKQCGMLLADPKDFFDNLRQYAIPHPPHYKESLDL